MPLGENWPTWVNVGVYGHHPLSPRVGWKRFPMDEKEGKPEEAVGAKKEMEKA